MRIYAIHQNQSQIFSCLVWQLATGVTSITRVGVSINSLERAGRIHAGEYSSSQKLAILVRKYGPIMFFFSKTELRWTLDTLLMKILVYSQRTKKFRAHVCTRQKFRSLARRTKNNLFLSSQIWPGMVVEKARFIEVTNYSLYDLIAVNKNTHHWILNVDYFQRTKNSNYVITSWIININITEYLVARD